MGKSNSYIDRFLTLKCAGDIINILQPISSGTAKEVSEAWTIFKRVRKQVFKAEKGYYNLVELCAGNPVSGLISHFCLPFKWTVSIDKRLIKREYSKIERYSYITKNIYDNDITKYIDDRSIIISSHPCKDLASRIVDIYNTTEAAGLYLLPCCEGAIPQFFQKQFLLKQLGRYYLWSYWLATQCCGKIEIDKKCISPKNCIITALIPHPEKDVK